MQWVWRVDCLELGIEGKVMQDSQQRFEVIIVGGGIVGATTACALAHAGINVALLDMFNPQRQWTDDSVDIRVSALTRASQNILETVGAWEGIVQRGVCGYKDMRVWDAKADGELHFDCADTEFNELGHIVENRFTVAALWDQLESLESATCISDAQVSGMQLIDNGRSLTLEDGRQFEADLIIAADGRDSKLRAMAGIDVTGWPYNQDGLVATIRTENSHQFTAWQRFLDEGPLAFLPLRTGECSIVWTLKTETAKAYVQLSDDELIDLYSKAMCNVLTSINAGEHFEGFGLIHLEANACGIPSLGSRNSGNESAILDGKTGYLCEQKNVNDIKEKMELIISDFDNDDFDKWKQNCITHAIGNSWEKYFNVIFTRVYNY